MSSKPWTLSRSLHSSSVTTGALSPPDPSFTVKKHGFYSKLIMVLKPNGDIHPNLDLKSVKFLRVPVGPFLCFIGEISWYPWISRMLTLTSLFFSLANSFCNSQCRITITNMGYCLLVWPSPPESLPRCWLWFWGYHGIPS